MNTYQQQTMAKLGEIGKRRRLKIRRGIHSDSGMVYMVYMTEFEGPKRRPWKGGAYVEVQVYPRTCSVLVNLTGMIGSPEMDEELKNLDADEMSGSDLIEEEEVAEMPEAEKAARIWEEFGEFITRLNGLRRFGNGKVVMNLEKRGILVLNNIEMDSVVPTTEILEQMLSDTEALAYAVGGAFMIFIAEKSNGNDIDPKSLLHMALELDQIRH